MEARWRMVAILLSLLGYQTLVAAGSAVSMETDDNVSTYDDSERDSFSLTSDVTDDVIDVQNPAGNRSGSANADESSVRTTAPPASPDPSAAGDPSTNTNSSQPVLDLTQKPHTKPRSRKKLRKLETGRTGKRQSQDVLDLPADEQGLTDVILRLKDQIKESQTLQTVTRSILNLVQEKQAALEEDLSFLKNEISTLHRLQSKDHDTIMALKDLVADNTWGVTSLVTSQEQLKKDVSSMKQEHDAQNATLWQLEEVIVAGVKRDESLEHSVQLLGDEIRRLRERTDLDHGSVTQLKQLLTAGTGTRRRHRPEQSNHIDQTSAAAELDLEADFRRLSGMADALDRKHELVEESIQDLSRMESRLKQDMQQFSQKFTSYDTELSRVYAMFYNLSFQMSSLENKMLQQQQGRYEANLAELQQSLVNFTQQIYALEQQSRPGGDGLWNSTGRRRGGPGYASEADALADRALLESQRRRLDLLEKIVHEHRLEQSELHELHTARLGRVNSSLARYQKSFHDHHAEAEDVFDFVDEKLAEFGRRIDDNDGRLLRLEVRVLNESLSRCEKRYADSEQNERIAELRTITDDLSGQLDDQSNLIDRLDHGMRRVFEDFGKHKNRIDNIAAKLGDVNKVVPQVSTLRQEVDKFLKHLPEDCDEVAQRQSNPASGVYLIKVKTVPTSAEVYCEFRNGESWTVIQRRQDGSESFARDWEAYRDGFGSADGEFWLGNENIHGLTTSHQRALRIEMTDLRGQRWWAEYGSFRIGDENDAYRLELGQYRGNATDALQYSADMPFSTTDRDNDYSSTHCARFYTAGWWYKHCHYGNLNGRYTVGVVWFNHDADEWIQLGQTTMMIRRLPGNPHGGATTASGAAKPKARRNQTKEGQPELT